MPRSFALALIIVACVTIYVFWRRDAAPTPINTTVVSLAASPTPVADAASGTAAKPSPTAHTVAATPAPFRYAISAVNQDLIRECLKKSPDLPRVHYTDDMRLTDLVHDLANGATTTPENLTMNLHVSRPDGSSQRLHLEPHDSEAKASASRWPIGKSDLRVFDVDAEGLPIDVPYPAALKLVSLKSVVDSFSSQGKVTFTERRFHEKFAQNLSADVVETDDHISELQLFFNGNSLGCAWSTSEQERPAQEKNLSCKCL